MLNEFDLIAQYFSRPVPPRFLGGGDDCALLPVDTGMELAASTDLLIQGRHFLDDIDPAALGHKALAVNLSDLAAMGASPLACLLSLSLPGVDTDWLGAFANGFYALADRSACPLVGGDTTRSPWGIIINVTVFGQVAAARALRRSAAKPQDDVWVSGTLGAADIALRLLRHQLPVDADLLDATRPALEYPMPPMDFAQTLVGVAHAAVDISDGLIQDLGHILKASHCGAQIDYDALPIDPALRDLPAALRQTAVLSGGDVYQLCFTASAEKRDHIQAQAKAASVRVSRIGRICTEPGLHIRDSNGSAIVPSSGGFDHFG